MQRTSKPLGYAENIAIGVLAGVFIRFPPSFKYVYRVEENFVWAHCHTFHKRLEESWYASSLHVASSQLERGKKAPPAERGTTAVMALSGSHLDSQGPAKILQSVQTSIVRAAV